MNSVKGDSKKLFKRGASRMSVNDILVCRCLSLGRREKKVCGLEGNSSSERRRPQGSLLCSSTLVRTNPDNTKPVRFVQFYADLVDILLNRRSGVIFTCERTGQSGGSTAHKHTQFAFPSSSNMAYYTKSPIAFSCIAKPLETTV